MIDGEESEILAGEGGGTMQGGGEAVLGDVGEGFCLAVAALEDEGVCGKIGNVQPEVIEEPDGEFREAWIGIGLADRCEELCGLGGGGRAELE